MEGGVLAGIIVLSILGIVGCIGIARALWVTINTNYRVDDIESQLIEILALLENSQPSEGLPRRMKYVDGQEDPIPV